MAQPHASSSSTLRDDIRAIWRRWWLVVIVIVAVTVAAFLLADGTTRTYQSTAAIGAGAGLLVGIALAFVVGRFDTRVRTHARAGEILRLPVLGHVPRLARRLPRDGALIALTEPEGSPAEALRVLRGDLDWARANGGWKSLLITSGGKREGKTLTVCNLAVTLALAGRRVVVVDADLRAPQVHTVFSLPNETGLTTVVEGTIALTAALRPFDLRQTEGSGAVTPADARLVSSPSEHGAIMVLTSGPLPPDPGEVMASRRLAITLKRLANSNADLVLVDAPPILGVGDVEALAPAVDALLLVADLDKTRRPTLEKVRRALAALPCRKPGVIIVGESRGASDSYRRESSLREDGGRPSPPLPPSEARPSGSR